MAATALRIDPNPSASAQAASPASGKRPYLKTKAEWAEWMLQRVTDDRKLMEDLESRSASNGRWRDRYRARDRVATLIAEEATWKRRIEHYKRLGL